jgi:hypothetical protein
MGEKLRIRKNRFVKILCSKLLIISEAESRTLNELRINWITSVWKTPSRKSLTAENGFVTDHVEVTPSLTHSLTHSLPPSMV